MTPEQKDAETDPPVESAAVARKADMFRAEETSLNTPADYEAVMEQCVAEMKRLQEQRNRDQVEIDRLKAETQAMLAKLKAT